MNDQQAQGIVREQQVNARLRRERERSGFEGHKETGTCSVCGRELTTVPVIDVGIGGPTCNIADDGRPAHTAAELRASFERYMRKGEPAR
jgi:hypothetical protein